MGNEQLIAGTIKDKLVCFFKGHAFGLPKVLRVQTITFTRVTVLEYPCLRCGKIEIGQDIEDVRI